MLCKRTALSVRPLWNTWKQARFIEDFQRQMKLVSGSGVSLSIGNFREPGGRVSLLGFLKVTENVPWKTLEIEHFSLSLSLSLSLFAETP